MQGAGVNPEIGQLAHVGIGAGLEHQRRQRAGGVGGKRFLGLRLGVDGGNRAGVHRRRHVLADSIQQHGGAHVARGRAHQHRDHLPPDGGQLQTGAHLVIAQRLAIEILVYQVVVRLSHRLRQLLAVFSRLLLERIGNLALLLPDERFHGDQVHHPLELVLGTDGEHHRQAPFPQPLLNIAQHLEEVRILPIHLVDEDEPGDTAPLLLIRIAPRQLGTHLHAGGGAHGEHCPVGYPRRRLHLPDEVGVPRGIDDVELKPLPLAGYHGEIDAYLALHLVGVIVRGRVPLVHLAQAGDRLRAVQHGLRQRCLARARMGKEHHIAHLLRGMLRH